ncbi:MAG: winged helix-turn-helix transcriptional regulator [Thermoplasmata archaeon]|jgi:predicted transcriptional regulator|nr:winged helix-turn-helix transcriptional regulator [Thermoplasmata archaeon]
MISFASPSFWATFSDIMNALGIANGNLAYHLSVLEKLEFLTSKREGRVRRIYPQGTPLTGGQGHWLGKTEVAILEKLAENEPVSNIALARSLGVSRQRTHYNLKLLQKRGLVERFGKLWMAKHSDRSASPSDV